MTPAEEDAPYSEECRKAVCELEQRFGVELVSIEHHEAAIRAAVAQERERCARNVRALYDEWMQEHGGESAFDAGRLGGLYSAEDAIRKGD